MSGCDFETEHPIRARQLIRQAAEIERLTAELDTAREIGAANAKKLARYIARVDELEGVRKAAKRLVNAHKPKDFAPFEVQQADRELRKALAATEQEGDDE